MSEKERCRRLTEKLGVEVNIHLNRYLLSSNSNAIFKIALPQFMQAHTVLKTVAHEYADKSVLVLGGRPGAVPAVAEEYANLISTYLFP